MIEYPRKRSNVYAEAIMKKILSALIIVTVVFTALSLLYVSANEGTATVETTGNVAAGNPGAGDAAVVGAATVGCIALAGLVAAKKKK